MAAFCLLQVKPVYSLGFKKCNDSQVRSIEQLNRDLVQRLRELTNLRTGIHHYSYAYVLRHFIVPDGRVASPDYKNAAMAYHNFQQKIKSNLDKLLEKERRGFSYQCQSIRNAQCKGDQTYAYVMRLGDYAINKIYLCPAFFKEDRNEQLRTLLHELSHLAANADHYFGDTFSDAGLLLEAGNAYFFEKLMFNDLEQILKRNAWVFLWRKPRP
jgi:hypothetical protein